MAAVLAILARLICGTRVRWAGCRPDTRQRIYFANHSSHFDFLVLWSALPSEVRRLTKPVAAKDYWDGGRLRRFLAKRVFHAVLVERGRLTRQHVGVIETMLAALGDRNSLILFPEGTRGTGETIGHFRSGLYHLARGKPGLELVPVYITNLGRILPKGEFFPIPLESSVIFGPPVGFIEGEHERVFLERARDAVLRLAQA